MKKTYIYLIIGLLLPMTLLTGCNKNKRLSLDERIGEAGQYEINSYEGVIESLENLDVYQQGTHKIVTEDYGDVIIQSPSINLNRYIGEDVLVKGTLQKGIGDAKDVFTVNEISYVDESRSAESTDYENKTDGFKFSYPSNWITGEKQGGLTLSYGEKEIVKINVFSDETDPDTFAAGREEGEPSEVTIGAQRSLRYVHGSQMSFYVPNPPKKKIYLISYVPGVNAVDDKKAADSQLKLFYDLLDSFELIYLNQAEGEKCGGLQQIECPEKSICQLDSDGKYAEGICVPIGGESVQANCPYIAPPAGCAQYRISEYSLKGCPSRYECVGGDAGTPAASFRDLNVVDAGEIPEDYEPPAEEVSSPDDQNKEAEAANDNTNEQVYDIPDPADVTALYSNERKGFSLLMPKRWYYAGFGPMNGALWVVGFSNVAFEEPEEAIITLSLLEEDGGKASKKVGDIYFVLDGPSDLTAVMEKMADSVEVSG
ncbi:hypothetical protein KJ657_05615 [Patescibacteria group bacterium]|nr:hypothetical protein [Patescibacteria group bacterium]MBU1016534.1 hypothetical protein [Patescibacteria group bacterium]MBU1684919.1 hypothetical protein [Patescibacteria group bacterium]MBU1938338.1 hypothetical protein [Patescibacteria group bacterium]